MDEYSEMLQSFNIDCEDEADFDMLKYFNVENVNSHNDNIFPPFVPPVFSLTDNVHQNMATDVETLKCEHCSFTTKDPICFLDHNMIMHEGAFGNLYYCEYCNMDFLTVADLDDHININHGDDDDDENIQQNENANHQNTNNGEVNGGQQTILYSQTISLTELVSTLGNRLNRRFAISQISRPRYAVENGRYECPSCDLKFNNQFHLGEHFTEAHQTYDEQLGLGELVPKNTFPSFRVLEEMYVVVAPYGNDKNYLKKYCNEKCPICCKYYSIYNVLSTGKTINGCDDLDEMTCDLKVRKMENIISMCRQHDIYIPPKLNTNKTLDKYSEYNMATKHEIKYPLSMACCKANICHDCLKTYLENSSGGIKCPYCTVDHTKYDMDYIRIIDIGNFNKLSWQEWWMKNDRVDILI